MVGWLAAMGAIQLSTAQPQKSVALKPGAHVERSLL
jgi:hypothetical protein